MYPEDYEINRGNTSLKLHKTSVTEYFYGVSVILQSPVM
jgi:hypothetical protein